MSNKIDYIVNSIKGEGENVFESLNGWSKETTYNFNLVSGEVIRVYVNEMGRVNEYFIDGLEDYSTGDNVEMDSIISKWIDEVIVNEEPL